MLTKEDIMDEIADYFQEASPAFGVLCSGDDVEWMASQVVRDSSTDELEAKIARAGQMLYDLKQETM